MTARLLMGNQALAYGALKAGVQVVTGYPGTPSTEVLETLAKEAPRDIYVEWSANEKVAMEVAAGAAYSGKRALVTMKQVGLNACADPVMSLEYVGTMAGMVIVVCDDPGPISSQTEQDTRTFGQFSKIPVFDPSTPEEAYIMIQDAFNISELLLTPVIVRSTTRVSHSCANVDLDDYVNFREHGKSGFIKGSKWVIFPRLSYENHIKIENRNKALSDQFSLYPLNVKFGSGKRGIVTGGVSFNYVKDAVKALHLECQILKISTPFPFPDKLVKEFLESVDEVVVFEELDPFIERELLRLVGQNHLSTNIRGKLTNDTFFAGENSVDQIIIQLCNVFGLDKPDYPEFKNMPTLPNRAPSLCAGCPHRASFYAIKKATRGQDAVYCGDIGCYTLGNAAPLNAVDTCLCMGAAATVAQGIYHADGDKHIYFAYIGDSTFFHTAIPSLVNAVYNQARLVAVILDNSTTAMTGHQPHPGIGRNARGEVAPKLDITKVLEGIGITQVKTVDPLDLKASVEAVKEMAACEGVSAIIFKSPCIALTKSTKTMNPDINKCVGCGKCVRDLGCPAMHVENGKIQIDKSLCTGCGLCSQVCPMNALVGGER